MSKKSLYIIPIISAIFVISGCDNLIQNSQNELVNNEKMAEIETTIIKPVIMLPQNGSTVEGPIITISGKATPGYRVVAHNNYTEERMECISTYGITDGNGIADSEGNFEFELINACKVNMEVFVSAVNEDKVGIDTCIGENNLSDPINFTITGKLHGVCNM